MKYSISVYEDYAIITGSITADVLMILWEVGKKEGFTHLTNNPYAQGIKLVRIKNAT